MKKTKRLLFCLLMFFVFYVSIDSVSAVRKEFFESNRRGSPSMCIYGDGTIVANANNCTGSARNWVIYDKADVNNNDFNSLAYCAQYGKGFPNNGESFSQSGLSDIYADAMCDYSGNSVGCSEFVAAIINATGKKYATDDLWYRWGKTQAYIWYFLAHNFNGDNKNSFMQNNINFGNEQIKNEVADIFWRAYEYEYPRDVANGSNNGGIQYKTDYNVSFLSEDKTLYYNPDCQNKNKQYLLGDDITIINNETAQSLTITLEIKNVNSSFKICHANGTCESDENGKAQFILRPAGDVNNLDKVKISDVQITLNSEENVEKVYVSVSASGTVNVEKEYYDTIYYVAANSGNQNVIEMVNTKGNGEGLGYDPDSLELIVQNVTIGSCPTKGKYDNYKYSNNTDPVEVNAKNVGMCANTKHVANFPNGKDDYTVDFSGCVCKMIEDGDKKVSVIITEDATFRFGNLTTPNTLFTGGGFSFVGADTVKNTSNGITTEYAAEVTWEYKDTIDGKGYYTENGVGTTEGDISSTVQNEVNKLIKPELNLEFYTYADEGSYGDNDSLGDEGQNVKKIGVSLKEYSVDEKRTVGFNSGAIKMSKACIAKDGKIKYFKESCPNGYTDGGNYHYIPLNYYYGSESYDDIEITPTQNNPFPFLLGTNDKKINFSIVEGITFNYNATCSVDVSEPDDDCPPEECPDPDPPDGPDPSSLYGIRYRSIDVNDPFPKENSGNYEIPSNWIDWWSIGTNKNRIYNTFDNYGNGLPLYRISFKNVLWSDDDYNSWESMQSSGVSAFVDKYFKSNLGIVSDNVSAKSNSYCKLGEFINQGNNNCDVY